MPYSNSKPFPHAIIEGLIPTEILEGVLSAFPSKFDREWDNKHERKKSKSDNLPPEARRFVDHCHSEAFLFYLSKLTGIEDLVPDPSLVGAGYHELPIGGFLGMHVDFTFHKGLGLYRRLNFLTYLNKDWQDADGGELFLGKEKEVRVLPIFGRSALFSTSSNSWHGNPNPPTKPRRSFALYYYSSEPSDETFERDTVFT